MYRTKYLFSKNCTVIKFTLYLFIPKYKYNYITAICQYIYSFISMKIGERIKTIAKSKGYTAQQLADKIGKTRQAVHDIYSGRVNVNLDQLKAIAIALKVPLPLIMVDSDDELYDLIPFMIPMKEIHKLMENIHDMVQKGSALVNLSIMQSLEGMYIFDYEFRPLESKLSKDEIEKFQNRLNVSFKITPPLFSDA